MKDYLEAVAMSLEAGKDVRKIEIISIVVQVFFYIGIMGLLAFVWPDIKNWMMGD